ncbi:CCDC69 isoform 8 [Pongo abelii]|uniref:CCDC69 isoform 8 n=1 Tax=Pongo abelii TaxID=9601 RepID=A0A2J8X692_PONAB|nr:CCDC69 isoform 8 [Pongo abelii]
MGCRHSRLSSCKPPKKAILPSLLQPPLHWLLKNRGWCGGLQVLSQAS